MNHSFIKDMCDAYYNDRKLKDTHIWENRDSAVKELFSELTSILQSVRLEESELYYEVYSYDTGMQQKIIYSLLDHYISNTYAKDSIDEGVLDFVGSSMSSMASHPGMATLGIASVIVMAIANWKSLSRAGIEILNALNKVNEWISTRVHEMTASGKVKRSILVTHLQDCGPKCGIRDWSNLSALTPRTLTGGLSTELSRQQSDCLRNCYLDWTISQAESLAKAYNECLKATGEKPGTLSDVSVLLKRPMGDKCSVYLDTFSQHHDNFQDAIEVLFSHQEDERRKWLSQYNQMISKALGERDSSGQSRDNRPPYPQQDKRPPSSQDNRPAKRW